MGTIFGAEAIVKCLDREGIEMVFGIPGHYNMPIFDALYNHPRIQVITVRHEQGAAFMADGYARATGKPAAIIPLPGPGLTNAMTGIGEAYYDSTPMLILVSQVARRYIDQKAGLLHEMTEQFEMLSPLTKFGCRIREGDEISPLFHQAMAELRSGRPRPVQIEIPLDIQEETMTWTDEMENLQPASASQLTPPPDQIEALVSALENAERPLIYSGGGTISSGASAELTRLAERLGAPVLMTGMGIGSVPGDHHLACGIAWAPVSDITPLVKECDLFLAIGTRFYDAMTNGWNLPLPPQTIRIDIDPVEIERNLPMEQKIIADAKAALNAIHDSLDSRGFTQEKEIHPALRKAQEELLSALKDRVGSTLPWMNAMRETLPRDTILSCDMSIFWADMLGIYPVYEPRTMLFPWAFGTLGFALPEAIGAKLAKPESPVVAICGDGAFLFTGTELATAMQYNLSLPIIIPNNNAYGMIKMQQRDRYDERFMSVDLKNPDLIALAHAFGANGEKASNPEEFGTILKAALKADKPTVIEIPWGWVWGQEN